MEISAQIRHRRRGIARHDAAHRHPRGPVNSKKLRDAVTVAGSSARARACSASRREGGTARPAPGYAAREILSDSAQAVKNLRAELNVPFFRHWLRPRWPGRRPDHVRTVDLTSPAWRRPGTGCPQRRASPAPDTPGHPRWRPQEIRPARPGGHRADPARQCVRDQGTTRWRRLRRGIISTRPAGRKPVHGTWETFPPHDVGLSSRRRALVPPPGSARSARSPTRR